MNAALATATLSLAPIMRADYSPRPDVAILVVGSTRYRGDLASIETAVTAIVVACGGACARHQDSRAAVRTSHVQLAVRGDLAKIWAALMAARGETDATLPSAFRTPVAADVPALQSKRLLDAQFRRRMTALTAAGSRRAGGSR